MLPLWKTCNRCGCRKGRWAFSKRTLKTGNVSLAPYDKACMQDYKKTWYQTRKLTRTSSSPSSDPSR